MPLIGIDGIIAQTTINSVIDFIASKIIVTFRANQVFYTGKSVTRRITELESRGERSDNKWAGGMLIAGSINTVTAYEVVSPGHSFKGIIA